MTPETKAAIAALPDDAPASAVMAAWAGYPDEFKNLTLANAYNFAQHERTLRRWLLDGGVTLSEWNVRVTRTYICRLMELVDGAVVTQNGEADTPEAAFAAAVEQFASALREEAK